MDAAPAVDSVCSGPVGGHVVQLYANERDLVEQAGTYLVEGLLVGDSVIVVATEAHRSAFLASLASRGIDVEQARAGGGLLVLDARETLDRLLVDGRPDADRFEAVIGGQVRVAVDRHGSVRAYGEMVSLLWEAGHVNAAIELEEQWNELRRGAPLVLYCAYAIESVENAAELSALHEICCLHSEVVDGHCPVEAAGADERSALFAPVVTAPRAARHFALDTLAGWDRRSLSNAVAVVVTELATNAVVHADSPFTLSLTRPPGLIRISVADGVAREPEERKLSPTELSGRGIRLVAGLADRWGVDRTRNGKAVWAEFVCPAKLSA